MSGRTLETLQTALAPLPRTSLGHLPTPLEAMPRLSAENGGAALYVKRDDCTGLGLGGNKIRQLEFYFGDAKAKGADTIIITGAVQSNYVRCAAAAAARLGMACHVQLEHRVDRDDHAYKNSGNVILDRLFGAVLHSFPDGEDEAGADNELEVIASELRADGAKPYVIHLSMGHAPLGALGYVAAAGEMLTQFEHDGLKVDEIVIASGSGHTHAGLLTGLRLAGSNIKVTGVCVRRDAVSQAPRILTLAGEIEALVGHSGLVNESDVIVMDEMLAPGYGLLNDATVNAMRLGGRFEGLVLDPVYTAKSMAGCLARGRDLDANTNVVYVHTGGVPGFFAYEKDVSAHLD